MTFAMMIGQWAKYSRVNSEKTVDMLIAITGQLTLAQIRTLRKHMK
jgi:hypothetical protein